MWITRGFVGSARYFMIQNDEVDDIITYMLKIIIKWATLTLSLWILATYVPQAVHVDEPKTLIWGALALGLLNALIRPILKLISFPVTLLTLGLFSFVINGLMLWLVPLFVKGITVSSFLWAILGAIAISFITGLLNHMLISDESD